jgi:hypothetical protein
MNRLTIGKLFLGACVALFGNIAWGQNLLIGTIPFSFRTAGTSLPSGKYEILTGLGSMRDVARVYNVESKKAILVLFNGPIYPPVNASIKPARLIFNCGPAGCALSEVWPGGGANGWRLPKPKAGSAANTQVATVTLPMLAANNATFRRDVQ